MSSLYSTTVSFRLPSQFAEELDRLAQERNVSTGTYARDVLIQSITHGSFDAVLNEMIVVHELVRRLREDQMKIAIALLADAGRASKSQAEDWVRENLL